MCIGRMMSPMALEEDSMTMMTGTYAWQDGGQSVEGMRQCKSHHSGKYGDATGMRIASVLEVSISAYE